MSEAWPRIAVVIVDYRKGERVLRNLASLRRQYDPALLDIVVVDNSECPANAALLSGVAGQPNVRLIVNRANTGYAAGCNLGAALARGELLLLLNPDIEWTQAGALRRLVSFMRERPRAAVVGPRQRNEDGTTPATARLFPRPLSQIACRTWLRRLPHLGAAARRYSGEGFDAGRTQAVDWLQSSCVLVRREYWERSGGLDERYFLFMADCDICWRAWAGGGEVWHVAEATVTADGVRASGGGVLALLRNPAGRHHLRDAVRYHRRHFLLRSPRDPRRWLLPVPAAQEAPSRSREAPDVPVTAAESVPP